MATTKGHGLKTFWNWLMVKLFWYEDWDNPLRTPPAFTDVIPHPYDPECDGKILMVCALCGGGERHPIHSVKVSERTP
jgi:hypothetical protein